MGDRRGPAVAGHVQSDPAVKKEKVTPVNAPAIVAIGREAGMFASRYLFGAESF